MLPTTPRDSALHVDALSTRAARTMRTGGSRAARARGRLAAVGLAAGLVGIGLTGAGAAPTAAQTDYLLLPRADLLALPTHGASWDFVVQVATSAWTAPELDDQDSKTNVQALAAALVYARTGDTTMRAKARHALDAMLPTYDLSMDAGLGPARQIAGWVLVADFIGLDGADDTAFRALLRRALTQPIGTHTRWGGSLAICQQDSDNNWGAWCGASRIAAALYLGDGTELDQAARVLRGFLGDRSAWSSFRGEGAENTLLTSATRSWSCDASASVYVPTNPDCGDRSGAFPSDAGRAGSYSILDGMYQSETTAGVVLGTELLYENGYSHAWGVQGALARIAAFDYRHGAWNLGRVQTSWPWIMNARLGTSYPTVTGTFGRSLGYTDWLYGPRTSGGDPTPTPTPEPTATPAPTHKPGPKQTDKPGGGSGGTGSGATTDTTTDTTAGTTTNSSTGAAGAGESLAGQPAPAASSLADGSTSSGAAPNADPGGDAAVAPGGMGPAGSESSRDAGFVGTPAGQEQPVSPWLTLGRLLLAILVLGVAFRLMRTIARADPRPGGPTGG